MKFKNSKAVRFEMKKSDTGLSADIYLYDIIGDSWDGTTAKQFATDLKALDNPKTLNVFINSPGGAVMDGVAIYNTLRRHSARKVMHIDGHAASIASLVAMAGDDIFMAKNAMMMIHNPWAFAMGDAKGFRKIADDLEKMGQTMIETYAKRSGSTVSNVSDWMNAETWFTAKEAIEAGFADSMTAEVEAAALVKFDLSQYRNIPNSLRTQMYKEPVQPAAAVATTDTVTLEPAAVIPDGTVPVPNPSVEAMHRRLRLHHLGAEPLSVGTN